MLLNLGEDVSEALVEDMISMVDKNGDREIDFEEFCEILFGAHPSVNSGGRELVLDPDLRNAPYMTEEARQEEQLRRNARLRGEALGEQMTERDKFLLEQKFASRGRTSNSGGGGDGGGNVRELGKSSGGGGPVRYRNDEVRYMFALVDEDGGGFLDQAEVAKLASHLGQVIRPRDLVDAMKDMDPEGTGEVTFEMFRNWLTDTGRHWSDLIVLPEGSVAAVREKAEQLDLLPDTSEAGEGDAAAIEWQRLSVLLKLMHSATNLWGKPTEMYGLNVIELERKITELTAFVERNQIVSTAAAPHSGSGGGNEQRQARQELRALREELRKVSPKSALLKPRNVKNKSVKQQQQPMNGEPAGSSGHDLGATGGGGGSSIELSSADNEKEAAVRRCFFRPMSAFRIVWDLVQVFLLLYLLIILPVRLSFAIDVPFNSFGFWFDVCVDLYFLIDIFVNFRTAFYDQRGMLVINQAEITRDYLHSWFLIDVGTCLPISYIMMILHGVEASSEGKQVRMLKILRLMKLAKLLRVTRLLRMLERYREHLQVFFAAFGSVLLGLLILITTHIFACIWYFVGTYEQAPSWGAVEGVDRTPGYDGWVYREYGLGCDSETGLAVSAEEHWEASIDPRLLDSDGDEGAAAEEGGGATVCVAESAGSRYATSMYWALMTISTVGYGDYTAQTNAEKLWCMVTMLVGSLIFAAITGTLSARMMTTKGAIQQFNTKMDEVRNYLVDSRLPVGQRRMIEAHYSKLWQSKSIYSEKEILQRLPSSLSTPVVEFLYEDVMGSAALFTQLMDPALPHGREILAKIALELNNEVANAGITVMQEGEYGDKMYLVVEGEVEIYRWFDPTAPTARLAEGERRQQQQRGNAATAAAEAAEGSAEAVGASRTRLGRLGPRGFFGERSVMRVDGSASVSAVHPPPPRLAVAFFLCLPVISS
jgi:hypothetical protein